MLRTVLSCLAGALFPLLYGCASVITRIDAVQAPPEDWPKLAVAVRHTQANLAEVCNLKGAMVWMGCAVVDFQRRTCTIHLLVHAQAVLDHELMHCRGYDHPGERTFRAGWENWKKLQAVLRQELQDVAVVVPGRLEVAGVAGALD